MNFLKKIFGAREQMAPQPPGLPSMAEQETTLQQPTVIEKTQPAQLSIKRLIAALSNSGSVPQLP